MTADVKPDFVYFSVRAECRHGLSLPTTIHKSQTEVLSPGSLIFLLGLNL